LNAPDGGTSSATVSSRGSPAASSMHHAAQSKGKTAIPNGQPGHPSISLSAMKSAPLDLASVERRGQPTTCREPAKKKTRPHDLQEAPTYHPTEEEWKNPFDFFRKITEVGRQYGICKVIPPESWNPDFAIDTEVCDHDPLLSRHPDIGRMSPWLLAVNCRVQVAAS
jgi:histone demethylase JARID1